MPFRTRGESFVGDPGLGVEVVLPVQNLSITIKFATRMEPTQDGHGTTRRWLSRSGTGIDLGLGPKGAG